MAVLEKALELGRIGAPVLGLFFGAIAVVMFPWIAWRWGALPPIYGSLPTSLAIDVSRYARLGSLRGLVWFCGVILAMGLLPLVHMTWTDPSSEATGRLELLGVGGFAWLFWAGHLAIATPPSVLLLGPSSPALDELLVSLNRSFPRYRVVSLLRPAEKATRWRAVLNNFRTRDLYQWRSIVYHLMDVVPLIVFCDDASQPVEEERQRLQRRGYSDRTLTTTLARLDDPEERQRVEEWLRGRLETVRDQEARRERQHEIVKMRTSVAKRLWYPRTVREIVEKAQALEAFALVHFMETCKEGGAAAYQGQLLEDMAGRVSRVEERQYLREDRAFEEIELLLDSAADELRAHSGANNAFNRASLTNKRAKLARYRGEWDVAERELRAALAALEELFDHQPEREVAPLHLEAAAACFNLGDVILARHRETSRPDYLEEAIVLYRRSLDHDRIGGGNPGFTERRLALLASSQTHDA